MTYLLTAAILDGSGHQSRARAWRKICAASLSFVWAGCVSLQLAHAQVSLDVDGVAVVQDFDTLSSSGSSNLLPAGWSLLETGSNANDTYAAGTGSSNSGNTYSFGSSASAERALGTVRSSSLGPTVGAALLNNTGAVVTSLEIDYWGEQWRLGTSGRQDRLDFQYSLDATSLSTGTWTDVDSLDFTTPVTTTVGATNGNDPAYRTHQQATILGLHVSQGGLVWIRWSDFDPSGSDDGLAIDDFSVTASTSDEAPFVTTSYPSPGQLDIPTLATLSLGFSESVDLASDWSELSCETSGSHNLFTSGGPTTYDVTVSGAFAPGETCEWTIHRLAVSDQDLPVDTMGTDHTTTFSTAGSVGCGAPATPIHAVQGSGSTSPSAGNVVTLEGVVVGDFQGDSGLNGFFLQEEDEDFDSDLSTSEGIFVFDASGSVPVVVGNLVRVTGQVNEYFDLTELANPTEILVCESGWTVTPTPITFPFSSPTALEAVEGMLVSMSQPVTASDVYNLGRYGEVQLSANGRLRQPTSVAEPGAPALAVQAQNQLLTLQLDDGSSVQNPATPPYLGPDGTLRLGDTTTGLQGVLGYAFGVYELHPTQPVVFERVNARPETLPEPGTSIRVASFNVLNYFTTLDTGTPVCGPLGNLDCRGANSPSELVRQRQKILSALGSINADVVGLMELENNASGAIADLVAGLNALMGSGTFAYIDTGSIGADAIKVGLIYKPGRVAPVGGHAILDGSTDPSFLDALNRPVLAQTFRQLGSGEVLTVAVNHLKSKGSACAGDPDVGDLQGNCNLTRLAAVEAEAQWLAGDPTGSGDSDFLLIGDFNAYAHEDPITALESAGYVNLIGSLLGPSAYSYVFEGQAGYLDYALSSAALTPKVSQVREWHINADEPRILDYNEEFNPPSSYQPNQYRASDHDPVVVDVSPAVAVPLPRWSLGALMMVLLALGCTVVMKGPLLNSEQPRT